MFQVFDGERPADSSSFGTLKGFGWDNSKFETFEEAVDYANNWLGAFGPGEFELGIPFKYNGPEEAEYVVIKEV